MTESPSADVRSCTYAFLARAFAPPPSGEAPVVWEDAPAGLTASLRDEVDWLIVIAGGNSDLTLVYQRLFLGPARPRVYPYESCYRDPARRLAGRWAEQVAAQYAAEGLTAAAGPSDGSGHGLLPDHIAAELAFMAYMTDREANALAAGDQDTAERCRRQQASFLQLHLLAWAPEFCRQVQHATQHPFYTSLARLLADWLALEADHLGLRNAAEAAPAYPTHVVARLCTLCGVCADVCQPQTLHLTWADDEARLVLAPDGCTGCRLCAEVCPFKALKLSDRPVIGVLASSPLLRCPDCGRPSLPEAFWKRLTRCLKPSDPAAVAARRCATCRASAVVGWQARRGQEAAVPQGLARSLC